MKSTRKYLFVINSFAGGGAERVVATLAEHFVNVDALVPVVVTLHPGKLAYPLPVAVRTISLVSGRFAWGPLKVLLLPLMSFELSRILRRESADGAISFLWRSNFVHALTRWFGNRRRLVLSERTMTNAFYDAQSLKGRLHRLLVRSVYGLSDAIIAISEGVKQELEDLGIPAEKVQAVHNPVDLLRFPTRSPLRRLPQEAFRLLSVGRLAYPKDLMTVLTALSLVKRTRPVHLTVVGEGPDRPALEAKARELGLEGDVLWRGWVDQPFANAGDYDVFIFSSLNEAFGNVLVEAMASGLPVISTDSPTGPREILANGEFGKVVPLQDAARLAKAIEELASEAGELERLREASARRATHFDVKVVAKAYEEILVRR